MFYNSSLLIILYSPLGKGKVFDLHSVQSFGMESKVFNLNQVEFLIIPEDT